MIAAQRTGWCAGGAGVRLGSEPLLAGKAEWPLLAGAAAQRQRRHGFVTGAVRRSDPAVTAAAAPVTPYRERPPSTWRPAAPRILNP
jgi:hypothetical protein